MISIQIRKRKFLTSMSKPQNAFKISPNCNWARVNPIWPNNPEDSIIQLRPRNKSCLTQGVNLKNIFET